MIKDFLLYFIYLVIVISLGITLIYLIASLPFWIVLTFMVIPISMYLAYDIVSIKKELGEYKKDLF